MYIYIYLYVYIYTYIHIYTYALAYTHIHIYTSNFVFRNRTAFYFFNFFNKSYLNDVFRDNANKFTLTCWTYNRRRLFVMVNECGHRGKDSNV